MHFIHKKWQQDIGCFLTWWYRENFSLLYHLYKLNDNLTTTSYRQTSSVSRTLVGNEIIDHSDVAGSSPVGAAPTTSSFPS